MPPYNVTGAELCDASTRLRPEAEPAYTAGHNSRSPRNSSCNSSVATQLVILPSARPNEGASGTGNSLQMTSMTASSAYPLPAPVLFFSQESEDFQQQARLFIEMIRVLNGGGHYGVLRWVQTFGRLGSPWTQQWFGQGVFTGMRHVFQSYIHKHKLQQYAHIAVGWFCVPRPFSKRQAQLPRQTDDPFERPV